jgi:uncharacterized protein (TIGR03435 family)
MRRCVACGILASALLSAQPPASNLSFEVAAVTLAPDVPILPFSLDGINGPPEANMRFQGGPGTRSPERIHYVGVTLKMLMQRAYGVKPEQVAGPNWLTTQRYSITAKVPPKTTPEECRLMLRNLLNERFQMRLHSENRSFRVYYLVVSKNGPKLKPPEKLNLGDDKQQVQKALLDDLAAGRARHEALEFRATDSLGVRAGTTADFVERISPRLDRPVLDRTQLEGLYNFTLNWVADGTPQPDNVPRGPSLFDALEEQLGLELKPATDQLPVFVIDAAQRTPVE